MNIVERNITVNMIRQNLEGLPHHPLPSHYSVRWYQPGDEELWLAIWVPAEKYFAITPELFQSEFGASRELLGDRQFFLLDEKGEAIGTATAWFDKNYQGQSFGRVHWVAITPEMQGLGLSKPMMAITCRWLRELGHLRACLGTSTARLAAINLYCQFGFRPDIQTEEDLNVWRELEPHLVRSRQESQEDTRNDSGSV